MHSRIPSADRLIEFLEALIKDADRKVFLIPDNLRVHHARPVKEWLDDRTDQIEIFYLPSYAPDLNPDLKHATIGVSIPKWAAWTWRKKLQQFQVSGPWPCFDHCWPI